MATPPRPPTWHVLGTGSMGCLWSAYLARSGASVILLASSGDRLKEYHGITLETARGSEHFGIPLLTAAEPGAIEALLVCTKAYDAADAVRSVAHRLGDRAPVVLLQNGMGFQDDMLGIAPAARVFCALTTEGAYCPRPFHVHHAGRGHTLLGRYPDGSSEEALALARSLPSAELDIRPVAAILPALWQKLAINCAINALTAIHGCRNGALLENPDRRAEFDRLCAEISAIVEALGMPALARELPARAAEVARATAANRSSMLQDVSSGRRTEIDFINGHLCRAADAAGVACPLNRALCEKIRELEGK